MFRVGSTIKLFTRLYGVRVEGRAKVLSTELKDGVGQVVDFKILSPKLAKALYYQSDKRLFVPKDGETVYEGAVLYFREREASVGRWMLIPVPDRRSGVRVEVPVIQQRAAITLVKEDSFEELRFPARVIDISEGGLGLYVPQELEVKSDDGIVVEWEGLTLSGIVSGVVELEGRKRLSVRFDALPQNTAKAVKNFIIQRQREVAKLLSEG